MQRNSLGNGKMKLLWVLVTELVCLGIVCNVTVVE